MPCFLPAPVWCLPGILVCGTLPEFSCGLFCSGGGFAKALNAKVFFCVCVALAYFVITPAACLPSLFLTASLAAESVVLAGRCRPNREIKIPKTSQALVSGSVARCRGAKWLVLLTNTSCHLVGRFSRERVWLKDVDVGLAMLSSPLPPVCVLPRGAFDTRALSPVQAQAAAPPTLARSRSLGRAHPERESHHGCLLTTELEANENETVSRGNHLA